MAEYDLRLNAGQYISELAKAQKGVVHLDRAQSQFDITIRKTVKGMFKYQRVLTDIDKDGTTRIRTWEKQSKSVSGLDRVMEKAAGTQYKLTSATQLAANAHERNVTAIDAHIRQLAALKTAQEDQTRKRTRKDNQAESAFQKEIQFEKKLLDKEKERQAATTKARKKDVEEFARSLDAKEKFFDEQSQELLRIEERRIASKNKKKQRDAEFAFTGQGGKETITGLRAIAQAGALVQKQQDKMAKGWKNVRQVALRTTGRTIASLKGLGSAVKRGAENVGLLEKGWRSFFRLIALRAAAGLIFKLKTELLQLGKDFAAFNKGVAETQTIIRPNEQNLAGQSRISDAIVQAAVQNNITLTDSVNAFYANLSNQVSNNLGGLTAFTKTAIRLSKATVSTLEESGNAISSVVQAYNLSFADAEAISATLFKTVDEGRLKLNEIANTLGTVGVPANALSISFEETSAALARLTLQGINVNRSQTLLRNVFLKLLKPTDKLQSLYEKWGVSTGEQAIQAFGLAGVLKKLNKESEKGAHVLPELFSRIRAIIGAQGLAGSTKNVEAFIDTLTEVSSAAEGFEKAIDIIQESAGERFQKELNKTKILFTDIFGQATVKLVNDLNDSIVRTSGGVSSLATVLVKTTSEVLAFAAAIAVAAAAAVAAKLAISFFGGIALASISILNPWVLAITAVAGAMAYLAGRAVAAQLDVSRLNAEIDKIATEKSAERVKNLVKEIGDRFGKIADDVQDFRKVLASVQKNYNSINESNKSLVKNIEKQYDNEVKIAEAVVNSKEKYIEIVDIQTDRIIASIKTNALLKTELEVSKEIEKVERAKVDASIERVKALQQGFTSDRFSRNIRGLPILDQINAQISRSQQLVNQAFNAGSFEEGRKLLDEARGLLTSADSSNFSEYGRGLSEQLFSGLEASTLNFERLAQQNANAKAKQAKIEIDLLEAKIKNNSSILEETKKTLEGFKDAHKNILEIIENEQLSYKKKKKLISQELGILKTYKGVHDDVLGVLDEQFTVMARITALQATQTSLALATKQRDQLESDSKDAKLAFEVGAESFEKGAFQSFSSYEEAVQAAIKVAKVNEASARRMRGVFSPIGIDEAKYQLIKSKMDGLLDFHESFDTMETRLKDIIDRINNDELTLNVRLEALREGEDFFASLEPLADRFGVAMTGSLKDALLSALQAVPDIREAKNTVDILGIEEVENLKKINVLLSTRKELTDEASASNIRRAEILAIVNDQLDTELAKRFANATTDANTLFSGFKAYADTIAKVRTDFKGIGDAILNQKVKQEQANAKQEQANALSQEGTVLTEKQVALRDRVTAAQDRVTAAQERTNQKHRDAKVIQDQVDATDRVGGATNLSVADLDARAKALADFQARIAEDPENKTPTIITNIADDADRLGVNVIKVGEKWEQAEKALLEQERNVATTNDETENLNTTEGFLINAAQAFVSAVNGKATATNNQAVAQERLNRAYAGSQGGNVQALSQGGTVYRAGGGFIPRGTDTVPAMLTPGEYVINARAARANQGLLSRINNSRPARPHYYAHGGSVSNFNNNISINTSGNEVIDARRIQRELNKGQRRGTSSSNPRNFA